MLFPEFRDVSINLNMIEYYIVFFMIKGKNTSCITTLNSQKNEYNSRKFSAFSFLFFLVLSENKNL